MHTPRTKVPAEAESAVELVELVALMAVVLRANVMMYAGPPITAMFALSLE